MGPKSTDLKELARLLPKAELHLHIEGTLEPELMFELAQKNRVKLPYKSTEEARRAYNFSDLQDFLNIYYNAMKSLVTETDFYDLTMAYIRRVALQGLVHAEIFFDPQAHLSRGVSFKTVVSGIHRALEDAKGRYGISSYLIMCFLRDQSAESAIDVLQEAKKYKPWIKAVGMDSKELGNPPHKFTTVFEDARNSGFLAVAHAGEEAPAEYIWEALDLLKISRIDHGYHMFEDPKLVERVAKERIPVTACPISSVGVNYFKRIEDVPIRKMLDLGIVATINSDDPAYFKGYLAENYAAVIDGLQLRKDEVVKLAKNSIEASFLPNAEKGTHIKMVDKILIENS